MAGDKKRKITNNEAKLIEMALHTRSEVFRRMFDVKHDINKECGYPALPTIENHYLPLYEREGLARRVVSIFPHECWKVVPEVYDSEDSSETPFEAAWKELDKQLNICSEMAKADELCGIGWFGGILLGFDDMKATDAEPLSRPVQGIGDDGLPVGTPQQRKLLYIRPVHQGLVEVETWEENKASPRYLKPKTYKVKLTSITDETKGIRGIDSTAVTVHWTRFHHIADGTSNLFASPRMQPVLNRILDVRKVLSGSGEMFWKGAFPGYSFEVDPTIASEAEINMDTVKEEMVKFQDGLQRFIGLIGIKANSLAPQVSDPTAHLDAQYLYIAVTIGVPLRVLLGTEEAQLAGDQDKNSWHGRVRHRQVNVITPFQILPLVRHLISAGVLPMPLGGIYSVMVDWPDLSKMSDKEKAEVAAKITEALSKYVAGGVETVMPPMEWLTLVLGFSTDEAKKIVEAAEERIAELEAEAEDDQLGDPNDPNADPTVDPTLEGEDDPEFSADEDEEDDDGE